MSLTARLTAFFLAALAVVLAGFSVALFAGAASYLNRQTDERLAAALDSLAAAVEVEADGIDWEPDQRLPHMALAAPDSAIAWAVRDDRGNFRTTFGTGPTWDHLAEGPADWPADAPVWRCGWRRVGSDPPLASPPPNLAKAAYLDLFAAVPLAPARSTLATLAATLAGTSAGIWLLAFLGGRWFCRRALRPVARMADAAAEMTATERERRLTVPDTGDELADLARSFNGLLDRLHVAYDRQSRFTGDASHQLRTPLAALLGQVEVCLRQPRSADEYRDVLGRVRRHAEHLRQVVDMLLFLARADAEAALEAVPTLELAAWLPDHLTRWSDHPRRIDLHVKSAPGPLSVRAQGPLLGQLLDNLLDNAWKYSPPGTGVELTLSADDRSVRLAVDDQGCGIAAEELAHIFDAFYRSASVRRAGHPGFGLGLSVARRTAVLFGGQLTATSKAGGGSRFELTLPRADE